METGAEVEFGVGIEEAGVEVVVVVVEIVEDDNVVVGSGRKS